MSGAHPLEIVKQNFQKKSITDIFHRLNRVLPEDQEVVTIHHNINASKALNIMIKNNYSQIPVTTGEKVLGVFSFRSFCAGIEEMKDEKIHPGDLPVDEFLEELSFVHINYEFPKLIELLNKDDAVLAGEPCRLQGIVTAIDVLKYLYQVASPFVLLAEIELALRELIHFSVDEYGLVQCLKESLSKKYSSESLPLGLDEMTFNDYIQIVCNKNNWPFFEPVFGGSRQRTRTKLEIVRNLRNNVFHFKRDLTIEEYNSLVKYRDWTLIKSKVAETLLSKEQIDG